MVNNMGIAVAIAAPSFAVQTLFSLPVLLAAMLDFGSLPSETNVSHRRPMSGSVLNVYSKSEMWGQPFEIASQSTTSEKLF
jgi:hypothetical protein